MNTELDKVTAENLRKITQAHTDKAQVAAAEKELPDLLHRAAMRAGGGKNTVEVNGYAMGEHGLQWLIAEMEKRGFSTHQDRPAFTHSTQTWWGW